MKNCNGESVEPPLVLDQSLKYLLSFVLLYVLTTRCVAADAVRFEKEIQPLLKKYCVRCHGPEKQKADLRFDTLSHDLVNGPDAGMWQEALDLINVSEMPPNEANQPTAAERQILVDALTLELRRAMEAKRSSGGRNVMRRLTAYEYNNTLCDLLGLDLNFAGDLPPEGTAQEGFKNNSTVLGTSNISNASHARPWNASSSRRTKNRRGTLCASSQRRHTRITRNKRPRMSSTWPKPRRRRSLATRRSAAGFVNR